MRLRDLHLERFGPFTGVRLDFGAGEADLHLVFGRNEAGKTTLGRAIRGVLYEIPARSPDTHVHSAQRLRLGATLERAGGARLALVRRKGRKHTLLDRAGEPLDARALDPYLGGVGPELFEALFSLTHERLEQGGRELLAGRGALGESLFGAGMGGGIHDLLAALRRRADDVFNPRAKKPPLNAALGAFHNAQEAIADASLRPADWEALQRELDDTTSEAARVDAEHGELLRRRTRLQRIARTQPSLSERAELRARIEALRAVPHLRESARPERERALDTLERSAVRAAKLEAERRLNAEQREKLHVPRPLLEREHDVNELADRVGAHRKAAADLPKLEATVATHRDAALETLRRLGRGESLDQVDRLRIEAATQARIRRLAREGVGLERDLEHARESRCEGERRIADLESALEARPAPRDPAPLARFVRAARQLGDVVSRQREHEVHLAALEAEVAARAATLARHTESPELAGDSAGALRRLPVPALEQVAGFDEQLGALGRERRDAERRARELESECAELERRLETLVAAGPVPTARELERARRARDRAWREVRSSWLDGKPPRGRGPGELADRLELLVREADDVSDRLRTDAKRVAEHATLEQERARRRAQRAELAIELAGLEEREARLRADWERLWDPAGIDPAPPGEMRPWLERHAELVGLLDERDGERERCAAAARALADLVERAGALLEAAGEPRPDPGEALAELLDRAEEVASDIESASRETAHLASELDDAREVHREVTADCARSEGALGRWRTSWGDVLEPLGLGDEAEGDEVEEVLKALDSLFERVAAMRSHERRIASIRTDAEAFAERVAGIARELAPDLATLPATRAADAIVHRLGEARASSRQIEVLEGRMREVRAELDAVERERSRADAGLRQLLAEAGCSDPEALPALEERARERRAALDRVRELEAQLAREGLPVDALEREVEEADLDALQGELHALGRALDECERRRGALRERIGTLRERLERMDGGAAGAEAAARAQEQLGELHAQVQAFARARLAASLLEREIERYRSRNQRPILARAAELFERLTLKRYASLATDFGEDDEPILICVARDGVRRRVETLSDGTRDQLFLALRLASLELYIDRNEPLPLILDDILINFDDHRAAAALAVLAELAPRTQVLFLTHHHRLIELAREAVPAERLTLHEL